MAKSGRICCPKCPSQRESQRAWMKRRGLKVRGKSSVSLASTPGKRRLLICFWLRTIRPDSTRDSDRDRSFFLDRNVSLVSGFGLRGGRYVFCIESVFSHRGGKPSGIVIQHMLLGNGHFSIAIIREHDRRMLSALQRLGGFLPGS